MGSGLALWNDDRHCDQHHESYEPKQEVAKRPSTSRLGFILFKVQIYCHPLALHPSTQIRPPMLIMLLFADRRMTVSRESVTVLLEMAEDGRCWTAIVEKAAPPCPWYGVAILRYSDQPSSVGGRACCAIVQVALYLGP